jgi:hypothetical protein
MESEDENNIYNMLNNNGNSCLLWDKSVYCGLVGYCNGNDVRSAFDYDSKRY